MEKMKKSVTVIIFSAIIALAACDDEIGPKMRSDAAPPAITSPSAGTSLVMTKDQADQMTSFSWSPADYGVPVGVLYTLQVDKAGNNFASPVDVVAVNEPETSISYADFNSKMVALETNMEQANQVELRVVAYIPNADSDTLYSAPVALTVTPYTAKDHIYLVGQHNGWNNATANVMNRNLPGLRYELYINLPAVNEGFKILPTLGSWDGDIGSDPANPGKLIPEGEQNMTVATPGFYRISVDLQAMTWSAALINWSVIGDFNGWAGDVPMTYDAGTGTLSATMNFASAGGFKFRANADWALNYGDTGADGTLEEGGDNIMVPGAGSYTVTLNLNPTGNPQVYTYTVVAN